MPISSASVVMVQHEHVPGRQQWFDAPTQGRIRDALLTARADAGASADLITSVAPGAPGVGRGAHSPTPCVVRNIPSIQPEDPA